MSTYPPIISQGNNYMSIEEYFLTILDGLYFSSISRKHGWNYLKCDLDKNIDHSVYAEHVNGYMSGIDLIAGFTTQDLNIENTTYIPDVFKEENCYITSNRNSYYSNLLRLSADSVISINEARYTSIIFTDMASGDNREIYTSVMLYPKPKKP